VHTVNEDGAQSAANLTGGEVYLVVPLLLVLAHTGDTVKFSGEATLLGERCVLHSGPNGCLTLVKVGGHLGDPSLEVR